ncbi:MAG: hypothetical protein WDN50_02865 [Bradyrhizobium sp.]
MATIATTASPTATAAAQPWGSGQPKHGEPDQRRDDMSADQGARLCRLGVRRSDHQHDRTSRTV